ncbi:MAG: GSCFA domain-containing protein [Bacteroidaceae bacterium]|nr:GSCFA domain-containing protein [Bacteroidaceae bacterium]
MHTAKAISELPLLRTPVDVPEPLHPIRVGDRSVFLGSCFAEHVGGCFRESRLRVTVNPLGVMYNPMSIVRLLTAPLQTDPVSDYVQDGGLWHTWLGDSSLSRPTLEACRQATEEALNQLREALAGADHLFLTFGTNHYYAYRDAVHPVANCHKVQRRDFVERVMDADEMAEALEGALLPLYEHNPHLQVVLTVSPYRYRKYGFHESQLGKAHLLCMADVLQRRHPKWVTYFPAYEIVLDELRDYRFYADDMLHPSAQAVQYIWQRMQSAWFSQEAREYLARWADVARMAQHRPLHPESEASEQLHRRLDDKMRQLAADYPELNL